MSATVRYIVNDVDAAIGFYRDALGFTLKAHPAPGFAALSRGELTLLVNAPGAGGAGTAGGTPTPGGWNRFQITTTDLDVLIADLEARGVRFRGDAVEGNAGRQRLVEDPSGNVVELLEPRPDGARP